MHKVSITAYFTEAINDSLGNLFDLEHSCAFWQVRNVANVFPGFSIQREMINRFQSGLGLGPVGHFVRFDVCDLLVSEGQNPFLKIDIFF